jgi:hypothetical protein
MKLKFQEADIFCTSSDKMVSKLDSQYLVVKNRLVAEKYAKRGGGCEN